MEIIHTQFLSAIRSLFVKVFISWDKEMFLFHMYLLQNCSQTDVLHV